MQRHYDTLLDEQRGDFQIIVDKTWEDLSPKDLFDDSVSDIEQICKDIDSGALDWFMLRVRVLFEGIELAENYVGGFLYADAREVLRDGTAEDMISECLHAAVGEAERMRARFIALDLEGMIRGD